MKSELQCDATVALTLLRSQKDHSPGNRVLSAALMRLAIGAGSSTSSAPLAGRVAQMAPELHRLLSDAESALERHWARRVLRAADPWAEVRRYPYYSGYVELCAAEARFLVAACPGPALLVIVGSGPLPVSAALLSRHLGCRVACVDRDPRAAALGASVLESLGIPASTHVDDGAIAPPPMGAIALVAALVSSREAVASDLLSSGTRAVAVRSAVGDRVLLYPALKDEVRHARLVGSSGVMRGVINTTLLFERSENV